jgi:3-dehydroquinate dehydratase I
VETVHDSMLAKTRRPLIVAVVASPADFERISGLNRSDVDLCELRIDLLYRDSIELLPLVRKLTLPKIVTVRDPAEGGANALSEEVRLQLFEQWLPECESIDIELRNISSFAKLARDAQSSGKEVIISFHDFIKTPPFEELMEMLLQSAIVPNRIFKAATTVETWEHVAILIRLIDACPLSRVAVMGMGALGKLSRLVLATAGSYLSYGSLGKSVAPGQWPVQRLRELLTEICD